MILEETIASDQARDANVAASRVGLTFFQLLQVIIQFGQSKELTGKFIPVLMDVLAAFQGGFTWAKVMQLIQKDGPVIIQLVETIAKLLGVSLPPIPPLTGGAAA